MRRPQQVSVPTIAAVFYIALIMPSDFSVIIGGLRLTPYRVLLLVVVLSHPLMAIPNNCSIAFNRFLQVNSYAVMNFNTSLYSLFYWIQ